MFTDFGAMQPKQQQAWGHSAYESFRDKFFFDKFLGTGDGAIVEHVKEITKTRKGTASAMLHLIADIFGGGVTGDNQLAGRETDLQSYWQEITIDQIRKAVKDKGKMADQRSVLRFREPARDKLGRWQAETIEEQLMLAASGISFAYNLDGSVRVTPNAEDEWTSLAYAADVKAPSSKRHFRWSNSGSGSLADGDTTQVAATDTAKYAMIPELIAEAESRRVKPVHSKGKDYFVFLVHPKTLAALWRDPDFRNAIVTGDVRGNDNKMFSGAQVTMHGAVIHSYTKVFNTRGAASGSKWGAGGAVDGTRTLLLGAQALALADLGSPMWEEEQTDFKNKSAIAVAKMCGILKPQFHSVYDNSTQDFGLMALDHAA